MAKPNRADSISVAPTGVASKCADVKPGMWRRLKRSSASTTSSTNCFSTSMQATENGAALARQIAVGSFRGSEALAEAGMLSRLTGVARMAVATGVDRGAGGQLSS